MMNERKVKELKSRRADLKTKVVELDGRIALLLDAYNLKIEMFGYDSDRVADIDEMIWNLRCRRADLVVEIEHINEILEPRSLAHPTPRKRYGCIFDTYQESDLDYDRILELGSIKGVRL